MSTLSTRRAYKAEHERKRRAAAKAKAPAPPDELSTANTIKAAWNNSPPPVREEFMLALGRMRDIRDDFNLNPGNHAG